MSDIEPTMPVRPRRSPGGGPGRAPVPGWVWLLFGSGVLAALVLVCMGTFVYLYRNRPAASTPGILPTPALVTVAAPTTTVTVQAPTQGPGPTPTVAPSATPTLPPAPPGTLKVGDKVQVVNTGGDGLSLRSEPGLYAPRMAIALDGELLEVVEGPRAIGGFTWWRLKRTDGVEGWGVQNFLQLVP